ncbi:MAG: S41 family peptidase [Verrucomicrobiota bacterium]|jgi:carboxyl-terminal processing protease
MKRRVLYALLLALLAANLLLGARIYFYSAQAAPASDNPYENYKLLADVMEKVRLEYVDGDKVSYQDLVHSALKGMLGSLDPHSEYMDARRFEDLKKDTEGEFGGIGIVVELSRDKLLTVVTPMDGSPGYVAGIRRLDQIIRINDKSTEKMGLEDAVGVLRGEPGTHVSITIHRPSTGEVTNFNLVRAIVKVPTVEDINDQQKFPLGENSIGYVRINQFGEKTSDDLRAALGLLAKEGMKALILDLRNNPGGLLDQAEHVCEQFLPGGQLIVSTEGRGPTPKYEYHARSRGQPVDVPMVVLVNPGSASAAEIVTGCLQDEQQFSHAIVIGEQTFGKGSVQSILPLDDGSALKLTTAKYYTPSHKVIHEHGITPDIIVPQTPQEDEDLRLKHMAGALDMLEEKDRERVNNTQDRQLERAVDLLKGVQLYAQRTAPAKVAAAAK